MWFCNQETSPCKCPVYTSRTSDLYMYIHMYICIFMCTYRYILMYIGIFMCTCTSVIYLSIYIYIYMSLSMTFRECVRSICFGHLGIESGQFREPRLQYVQGLEFSAWGFLWWTLKSCMTLSTCYLGNNGTMVY